MGDYRQINTVLQKISELKKSEEVHYEWEVYTYTSTQTELRMQYYGSAKIMYERVQYPRNLQGPDSAAAALWDRMYDIEWEISRASRLHSESRHHTEKISLRRKNGAAEREDALKKFKTDCGNSFLTALPSKKLIADRQRKISELQGQQRVLVAKMIAANKAAAQTEEY